MILFSILPGNRAWHFIQIVSFPLETIWVKCQTLFPWKHNKNIWRCHLPKMKVSMAKVNGKCTRHSSSFAFLTGNQKVGGLILWPCTILSLSPIMKYFSMVFLSLLLIQEVQLSELAKGCVLTTGKPLVSLRLFRKSVVRLIGLSRHDHSCLPQTLNNNATQHYKGSF